MLNIRELGVKSLRVKKACADPPYMLGQDVPSLQGFMQKEMLLCSVKHIQPVHRLGMIQSLACLSV